jgi:hypothetical protein
VLSLVQSRACTEVATARRRRGRGEEGEEEEKKVSDKMAPLPLLLAAFSLLFAVATPIRDITDACSSQVQGLY